MSESTWPDMTDAAYDAFADACPLVNAALDGGVTFEWPGTINVLVTPHTMLIYGQVNETIAGNVAVLNGDLWDESPELPPDTDVPSTCEDPRRIAAAIVLAVRRFERGQGRTP